MLYPPFKGSDMEGLFHKIVRGHYVPISTEYSNDLSNLIRTLLQVNSSLRPSCERLMDMPLVTRNIEAAKIKEVASAGNLLSTIKINENSRVALPPANYHNRLISIGAIAIGGELRSSPKSYDLLDKNISKNIRAEELRNLNNEVRLKLAYPPMFRADRYMNIDQKSNYLIDKSRGNARVIWHRS